jgi:hypothetical protein
MRDVSRLEGAELDYAVATAAKVTGLICFNSFNGVKGGRGNLQHYSTDWSIGGPIIEREKIAIRYEYDEGWGATVYLPNGDTVDYLGPTPLVAAMRCFVAAAESRAKEDAK